MKANEAKILLYDYYLSRSMPCMTEMELWGMFRADVVAVDSNLEFKEVEIKVNEGDLMGELNSIKAIKENKKPDGFCTKYLKHLTYLKLEDNSKKHKYSYNSLIPNKFYFALPEVIFDIAKEYLKDTPYGLIFLPKNSDIYGYHEPSVSIKAKKLHNKKITEDEFKIFLMRTSREARKSFN